MNIVTKPSFYVIGKKVSCTWERLGTEMPSAWNEVLSRKSEFENRVSPYILDICLHLRDGVFTQLIGAEVSRLSSIPAGFEGVQIPEQTYIYTKHTGSVMEIANSFGEMIDWAKENNHTIDPDDFKIQNTPDGIDEEGYDLYLKIVE
jgi:predicted transcriptional regulator YdeE